MDKHIIEVVNATEEPSFMIFENKARKFPFPGVPDTVPGLPYRTGPKGRRDQRVFVEWLSESSNRRLTLVDNYDVLVIKN